MTDGFTASLRAHGLETWAERAVAGHERLAGHGDFPRWKSAIEMLPPIDELEIALDRDAVTLAGHCHDSERLEAALRGLMPWRKGPFRFADVVVDAEWRSNLKWDRVRPHLAPLAGRRIVDVGCGNGYYGWRMLAQNPALVVGVEPSALFNLQFAAVQRYAGRDDIGLLPVPLEALPTDVGCFDTALSMGVLYHRKSPLEHLLALSGLLRPGGELCLETLVIEGGKGQVLVPPGRYARMRNVWFIPSAAELAGWLERCGFVDVRVVDENVTGIDEQRSTAWMRFESLAECLDLDDPARTVEGLPAPRRGVIIAQRESA